MSRSQRLTFLGIAAVIAVVAVIVILAVGGGDDGDTGSQASATQTATPTPTASQPEASPQETETPAPAPELPLLEGGKVTRLEYKEGDTVKFRVVSDEPEEVHIHGYDIAKDLEPGKEITVTFKATIEGIFEIEFEDAGEQIGELRVEPK